MVFKQSKIVTDLCSGWKFGDTRLYLQVGTLENYFGDLGLYDFRPLHYFETVGVSGRYQTEKLEILGAVGDSGYAMRQVIQSILQPVDLCAIA